MKIQSDSALRNGLTASLGVQRWVDDVVEAAPYGSLEELLSSAAAAATPLTRAEITEAMAHHPRIGEAAKGDGVAQTFSRSEQASVDSNDAGLAQLLSERNRAYEERFDRVFLIRAAGRSRAEILAELDRRILLDDESELEIVGQQLREIALLRIEKFYGESQ